MSSAPTSCGPRTGRKTAKRGNLTPPETRYAKSGDVYIAYQVSGTGPFDLVWVQGYVNNIELHWEFPEAARSSPGSPRFAG